MNSFKCLTDNYSQHRIRKATSLECPLSLKSNLKNRLKLSSKANQHLYPLSFVSLITWSLVIKLSLVSGPLGQYLLVLCQALLENNQSCSCAGLVEVPQHKECNALLFLWRFDDKSFYQKLTVLRIMNMQWLSLVLKHRNMVWHLLPLSAAAQLSNELSCSFTFTVFAVMAQFENIIDGKKLIAKKCSWFC